MLYSQWIFMIVFLSIETIVSPLDNGLARLPPMGWVTWCTESGIIPCLSDWCDEKEVRDIADHMVSSGLRDLGYNYVNLDDCWAGNRTANGTLTADPSRFPSGMKALADYLHSKGLLLGVYTDAGEKTCRGGRPGSWPYYKQDAKTFAMWGVDFVKMDWCDHPGGYNASELYGMMRDALNATGKQIVFSMCEWGLWSPWKWGAKTANLWRVGPDHLPLWWTPGKIYDDMLLVELQFEDTSQDPGQGQGTANIIQHMAGLYASIDGSYRRCEGLSSFAGPGGWNDPDFLMPGEFWMWEVDRQTEFSFWCLWAAPLIVATDIRDLSDKQVLLNKEAIAVNQDPLGIAGDRRAKYSDGGEIWSKPLSNNTWAVILYNSNLVIEHVDVTIQWNSANLPGWPQNVTNAAVRDLWAHKDLGTFANSFKASSIEAHGSLLLKVTPQA